MSNIITASPATKSASPARYRVCPSCKGQIYLGNHGRTYLCSDSINCGRTVRVTARAPHYRLFPTT